MKKKLNIGNAARNIGTNAGEYAKKGGKFAGSLVGQGGMGLVRGFGEGLFGHPLGGLAATSGALMYGMNKLNNAFSLTEQLGGLMSGGIEGRNKVMADVATRKWRKKMTETLVPQSTFEMEDLANHAKNLDAGVAEVFKGLDQKKYQKIASESIRNDNPTALYDMIIREAQSKGKKVNLKKPFFLPNVFNKDGKKYAYAIDASEVNDDGKPNVRFVPVPIGRKPFEEPDEE